MILFSLFLNWFIYFFKLYIWVSQHVRNIIIIWGILETNPHHTYTCGGSPLISLGRGKSPQVTLIASQAWELLIWIYLLFFIITIGYAISYFSTACWWIFMMRSLAHSVCSIVAETRQIHTDYRVLWRKRNGTATLSRGECPNPCLDSILLA